MGDVHYMISEAAKQVNVEPHALRYWEDELELTIGRTEMGHRYYTKDDIQLFCCIKELKEQGMILRDLKELIPDMLNAKAQIKMRKEPKEEQVVLHEEESLEKTISRLLAENNKVLSEMLLNGAELLLQLQERQEEERYRKLDYLIRQQQNSKKNTSGIHLFRLRKMAEI